MEIEPELRVRFPARGPDFDDGFEVGLVAAQMGMGGRLIERVVGASALPQLTALARAMSYRLVVRPVDADHVAVTAEPTHARPALRLVR
jgi:hypothetical protein